MWPIFKFINLFWLLASTYIWITSLVPMPALLAIANVGLLISFNFLPVKFQFDVKTGLIILAMVGLMVWFTLTDGWILGVMTVMMCIPVLYLIQLPNEYRKDLLGFVTRWYAALLIPAILLYWILLISPVPPLGRFIHPEYKPYLNYIFYIKTTFDYGTFERFNAFFLEPGHQALVSSFIMMANRYEFKRCPWLYVLAVAVVFSFSLAGYILSTIGFVLLKVNSVPKALGVAGLVTVLVVGAITWGEGDNALNELIISRLEYDESMGIKGNNRFFDNTDYEYDRALGTKYFWLGAKGKANMDLVSGAGYKIYILNFGMVGVILAFLFYMSLLPSRPDYRFTISFLIVLILCFFQRAYPFWYSWLFPFVISIYIAQGDKKNSLIEQSHKEYYGY